MLYRVSVTKTALRDLIRARDVTRIRHKIAKLLFVSAASAAYCNSNALGNKLVSNCDVYDPNSGIGVEVADCNRSPESKYCDITTIPSGIVNGKHFDEQTLAFKI
ncbi:hypothetical protein GWI33_002391 [Rhynchophorus ferrugineus]|uniref:Uncharacterized protein n=1 Tax=Rhynchophorus ferrugineus TaxID=354439 RepID=A0A834IKC9_RHYFE|nr:hypothetical protein GWI33_002391 [Rhynchophorus ferrugineus]